MSRNYAKLFTSIWQDDDFVNLSSGAQRMYFLLISQPNLNVAGILPYAPKRWSELSSSSSVRDTNRSLRELSDTGFVCFTARTSELLIVSHIKHDEGWKVPNIRKSIVRAIQDIQDDTLRERALAVFRTYADPEGLTLSGTVSGTVNERVSGTVKRRVGLSQKPEARNQKPETSGGQVGSQLSRSLSDDERAAADWRVERILGTILTIRERQSAGKIGDLTGWRNSVSKDLKAQYGTDVLDLVLVSAQTNVGTNAEILCAVTGWDRRDLMEAGVNPDTLEPNFTLPVVKIGAGSQEDKT